MFGRTVLMPRMPDIWDDTKFITSRNNVRGTLACWAIRQSPYDVPDNLVEALVEFEKAFADSSEFFETSCKELGTMILEAFGKCPMIQSWNKAKDGSTGPVFSSRFDQPSPDHDFIDLDALARNVSHDVTLSEKYSNANDG